MEKDKPNRGSEIFDVGAVAVENSDKPDKSKTEFTPTPPDMPPPVYTPKHKSLDSEVLEQGEHLVCIVRRHPIGLVGIYLEALAALAAIFALLLVLAPSLINNSSTSYSVAFLVLFVVVIFAVIMLVFVTYIYRKSRMIVTDRSLIQVIQRGLFNRKISRLSMSNVEDVSVEKKGLFPTMFNFGTLNVQTAGEVDNFLFPLCPTPDEYASLVLEARQAYTENMRAKKSAS